MTKIQAFIIFSLFLIQGQIAKHKAKDNQNPESDKFGFLISSGDSEAVQKLGQSAENLFDLRLEASTLKDALKEFFLVDLK